VLVTARQRIRHAARAHGFDRQRHTVMALYDPQKAVIRSANRSLTDLSASAERSILEDRVNVACGNLLEPATILLAVSVDILELDP
jgi:hypothetical protein